MDFRTPALVRARHQLEERGTFPGGALPADIAESWTRSLAHGLDPRDKGENLVLTQSQIEQERTRYSELIRFARPELELLYDQIAGSNFLVALGSPEGLILETLSDTDPGSDGAIDGVIVGSVWTEALRGTNALGLTLETRRAAEVYGGEHFLRMDSNIACLSAPIFDGRGGLAGLLDASSRTTVRQQHTAALVRMSASNIENSLIRQAHDDYLVLQFHPRPEYLGTLSVGMLVLDKDFAIHAVNRRGALFLSSIPGLIGRSFTEVFDGRFEDLAARLVRGETLRIRDRFGSAVSVRCVANRASFALASRHQGWTAPDDPRQGPNRALFKYLVVEDQALWAQLVKLPDAARRGLPIVIEGQTGTGKDVVARLAHTAAGRERPFLTYDGRLATEDDFTRAMFGEGDDKPGLLEQVQDGTLYIDEVTRLPPRAQAILVRIMDTGEYRREGSSDILRTRSRIIASTTQPLDDAARSGKLSPELRFRLSGYTITLPPLSRRSDIAALARRFLAAADPDLMLDEGAVSLITSYPWPGNLHELRARMMRAARQAEGRVIQRADLADLALPEDLPVDGIDVCPACAGTPWKEQRCRLIRAEVSGADGNIAAAARRVGVSRTTIYKHLA